jgi:energy-coupling factor transporter ATP-binding protein EcfA2
MSQPPADPLSMALDGQRLLAVSGPNFSGRTELLRHFCDLSAGRIYLGPEVYNSLSGLSTSVRQEIELHSASTLEASGAMQGLADLQLTELLEQNPGMLSGGEQACLAVLCGLVLRPPHLAIDCALEQLDSHRLARAISLLANGDTPLHGSVVTDNRLDEWPVSVRTVDITQVRTSAPTRSFPPMTPETMEAVKPVDAPSLAMHSITAGYRKRPAVLRDLAMNLEPGKVYVLLGPNGAGKSTCAKVLCGVLRPTSGEIRFGNAAAQPWKTPGRTVGYHLQNPDVGLFESTVQTELSVGGDRLRAQIVLEAFGLKESADANPLSLPFPIRKRVSLAATIAGGKPWMFLDEPTLGADAANIAAIARVIKILAARGHGVIVVSHSQMFRKLLEGIELTLENGSVLGK